MFKDCDVQVANKAKQTSKKYYEIQKTKLVTWNIPEYNK